MPFFLLPLIALGPGIVVVVLWIVTVVRLSLHLEKHHSKTYEDLGRPVVMPGLRRSRSEQSLARMTRSVSALLKFVKQYPADRESEDPTLGKYVARLRFLFWCYWAALAWGVGAGVWLVLSI